MGLRTNSRIMGLVFLLVSLVTFLSPTASGLAIVRRNVLRVPHDIYPGYSIKKFGSSPSHAYHLLPNDYSNYFTVLDNGLLMSTANISNLVDHPVSLLVREEVPDSNVSTTFTVQLYVLERGSMLAFPQESYQGHVVENSEVGTGVSISSAGPIRPTADPSRKLKYEIVSGDGKGLFHVGVNESTRGLCILTTQELDRETKKEYTLVVKAYDLVGVDTALTRILITIDDLNDNAPIFENSLYRWAIPVNTTRFTNVGTVKAVDADGDRVSYRLASPSPTFVVVPQTGQILLVNTPEASSYELEVEAHDSRSPTMVSTEPATVLIQVGSEQYLGNSKDSDTDGLVVVILDEDDSNMGNELGPTYQHRITKRRVTRAVRPTVRKEFTESEGMMEGRVVFELVKEVEFESFKIRDENPWVTVEPSGAVRVKKKWDYEELGQEKTIDFWVMITNPGTNSGHVDPELGSGWILSKGASSSY